MKKLRPFTIDEKSLLFNMATKSEATPFLYGKCMVVKSQILENGYGNRHNKQLHV